MKLRIIFVGVFLLLLGVVAHAEEKKIIISGTAHSKNGSFAVIEGKSYSLGEIVSGYKIIAITDKNITVVKSGKTNLIQVFTGVVSAPPIPKKKLSFSHSVKSFLSSKKTEKSAVVPSQRVENKERSNKEYKKMFMVELGRSILFLVLVAISMIFLIISSVWFLVVAFTENIWWGFACLFFEFPSLLFLIFHWDEAKKPFLLGLLGLLVMIVSMGFMVSSAGS